MSLYKFSTISVTLATILAGFICFQVQAHTLRSVVQHTIQTNPEVLRSAKIKHASNQQISMARAGFFPTLDLHAGVGRERVENSNTISATGDDLTLWRHDVGLILRQNVFHGFLDYYEVRRTKAKTDADAWAVCATSQDVAILATESYLNVLRERRKVQVGEDNLSEHNKIYNMIEERGRSGLGRKADIAQATGRLALAKSNLYAIQNDMLNSKVNYHAVTGLEARGLSMPPDPSQSVLPRTEEEAIYQALKFHPKMRLAVVDVEERRAQHSVSHYTAFPSLDIVVEASNGRNFNGSRAPQDRYFAGLELNYNLFNGGADIARQRETAYLTQEAAEIRNRTCREVTENVQTAWNNLQTARIRLSALKQHKVSSEKTKIAYYEQFKLGKRTLFDLLDSQNEEFASRLAYVNGIYEVYIMEYRLLNSTGRLLGYLGVNALLAAHPEYDVYDHRANPTRVMRHFDAGIHAEDWPSKWYNQENIEHEPLGTHPCQPDCGHHPNERLRHHACKVAPAQNANCGGACPHVAHHPVQHHHQARRAHVATAKRLEPRYLAANNNASKLVDSTPAKTSKRTKATEPAKPAKVAHKAVKEVPVAKLPPKHAPTQKTTRQAPHNVHPPLAPGHKRLRSDNAKKAWAIEIGKFKDQKQVDEVISTLKKSSLNGYLKEIQTTRGLSYELFVGPMKNHADIQKYIKKLKALNIEGEVVRV